MSASDRSTLPANAKPNKGIGGLHWLAAIRCNYVVSAIIFCLTSACSNYDIAVNNNVVYTPPTLLQNYTITDAELGKCVEKSIRENQITNIDNLHELICARGNIADIHSLQQFAQLKRLNLDANKVSNPSPLASLASLEHLNLANNSVIDASTFTQNSRLKYLDLRGNKQLKCETTRSLDSIAKLYLPKHCQ